MKHNKFSITLILISVGILASSCATTDMMAKPSPLVIREQGSFAVGGTLI